MFRLIVIILFLTPVIFVAHATQGEAIVVTVQETSTVFEDRIDAVVEELGSCESKAIPIYFNDRYISTHSADLVMDVATLTRRCDIASVTVYVNTDEKVSPTDSARAQTTIEHLKAADIDAPIYSRMSELSTPRDMRRHGAILIEMAQ